MAERIIESYLDALTGVLEFLYLYVIRNVINSADRNVVSTFSTLHDTVQMAVRLNADRKKRARYESRYAYLQSQAGVTDLLRKEITTVLGEELYMAVNSNPLVALMLLGALDVDTGNPALNEEITLQKQHMTMKLGDLGCAVAVSQQLLHKPEWTNAF